MVVINQSISRGNSRPLNISSFAFLPQSLVYGEENSPRIHVSHFIDVADQYFIRKIQLSNFTFVSCEKLLFFFSKFDFAKFSVFKFSGSIIFVYISKLRWTTQLRSHWLQKYKMVLWLGENLAEK